jgi:hypothetical protein
LAKASPNVLRAMSASARGEDAAGLFKGLASVTDRP